MNVSMRSLALLIRSFPETSINPNFRHSLLHEHLYRYHVMGEHSLPDPGFTPYYDKDFFQLIQQYKTSSTMNIATMSIKEWYTLLLEDKVLMSPATDVSPAALLPVRAEVLNPNTDWTQVWQIARTKGLGSELISFQFKLLHNLLPTQERIARLGLNEDHPRLCLHCRQESENLVHSFFDCTKNIQVGLALLGCVQQVLPDLSTEAAVLMDFGCILPEEENLAVQCILTTGLKYIWEARLAKKVVTMFRMRAEIEARVSILRKTRFNSSAQLVAELINILN